jgi:hypothetical protein
MNLHRSPKFVWFAGSLGVLSLYVAGVVVRSHFGIRVTVQNGSQETLRLVSIKVESLGDRGGRYSVPDLRPGDRRRVFASPVTESHLKLEFTDANNIRHSETVYGYAEAGYCGAATATVLSGDKVVVSSVQTDLVICWRSWLDFI